MFKMNLRKVVKVPEHSRNLLEELKKQRETNVLCDITIKVKNREFNAHRNVLAASSDYFRKMFTVEMKEKYDRVVELREVTPGAVEEIFKFFYTEQIELSNENVNDILHATSVMQISSLLAIVNEFLTENVSPPNCLCLRELGRFYSLPQLTAESQQCVMDNFEKVIDQTEFAEMSIEDVEDVLRSDELKVASESIVYSALVKWIKHSANERRDFFPRLFKHVRLQLLQADFLSDTVSREPLVRDFTVCRDLVEEAFRFHLNPNKSFLPKRQKQADSLDTNCIALINETTEIHIFNLDSRQWNFVSTGNQTISRLSAIASRGDDTFVCAADGYLTVKMFSNGQWKEETSLPEYRSGAGAAFVDGQFYLIGGEYSSLLNSVFTYDFETKTWKEYCKMRTARSKAAVVAYGNNEVYVLGGYNALASTKSACCTVERLSVAEKTWTQGSNMNAERADFGAVHFNEKIYAFGGLGNNNVQLSTVEFLDMESGVWTTLATQIPAELGATSACLVAGRVALLGSSNKLLSFDPCSGKWRVESQVFPTVKAARLVAMRRTGQEEEGAA